MSAETNLFTHDKYFWICRHLLINCRIQGISDCHLNKDLHTENVSDLNSILVFKEQHLSERLKIKLG